MIASIIIPCLMVTDLNITLSKNGENRGLEVNL